MKKAIEKQPKLDRIEMDAIRTIVRSKVDAFISKKEQKRQEKHKALKEAFEKIKDEIVEDLGKRYIEALGSLERATVATRAPDVNQQIEVLLAEIILTDRSNIMKRIDEIVKTITEG